MIRQSIPDLEVPAYMPDGSFMPIRLTEYAGRWLVLFFWPLDFTHVSPTEIRAYERLASQFVDADTILIGASIDSVYTHRAWVQNGLGFVSFPMLGDVTRGLTKALGILLEDEGVSARATFIVDPSGVVVSETINALNVARSANDTFRLLQSLQAGSQTPLIWRPSRRLAAP